MIGTVESPEPSPYVRNLPIGVPLESTERDMSRWDEFPWTGQFSLKQLEEPVLPEPPRSGEAGPEDCWNCKAPDDDFVWADDRWRLSHHGKAPGLPIMVLLHPRAHHDFADLPADLTAELGPMLQRAERAVLGLGGIGRVHVYRWGDGGAHLHWWLVARPEGMLQMRGTLLPLWNGVLPPIPEADWNAALASIAESMALSGGTVITKA
jgi:diadenosine tetraphosphate (Ap4A) HIT family hydrolase